MYRTISFHVHIFIIYILLLCTCINRRLGSARRRRRRHRPTLRAAPYMVRRVSATTTFGSIQLSCLWYCRLVGRCEGCNNTTRKRINHRRFTKGSKTFCFTVTNMVAHEAKKRGKIKKDQNNIILLSYKIMICFLRTRRRNLDPNLPTPPPTPT